MDIEGVVESHFKRDLIDLLFVKGRDLYKKFIYKSVANCEVTGEDEFTWRVVKYKFVKIEFSEFELFEGKYLVNNHLI